MYITVYSRFACYFSMWIYHKISTWVRVMLLGVENIFRVYRTYTIMRMWMLKHAAGVLTKRKGTEREAVTSALKRLRHAGLSFCDTRHIRASQHHLQLRRQLSPDWIIHHISLAWFFLFFKKMARSVSNLSLCGCYWLSLGCKRMSAVLAVTALMDWKRTSKYILWGLRVAHYQIKAESDFLWTSRENVVENHNKNREPKMKRNNQTGG